MTTSTRHPSHFSLDPATRADAEHLIELALLEDLSDVGDLTSLSMLPADRSVSVQIRARQPGVLVGSEIITMVLQQFAGHTGDQSSDWMTDVKHSDGCSLATGTVVAELQGPVRLLLTAERTILNLLIHLCGIASLTAQYVQRVSHTRAVILDTRKTLPGYRRLQKYAVLCGGGTNHRMGLHDGMLIKDNHLAARENRSVSDAVRTARKFLREQSLEIPVEVEVDTLDQLSDALRETPDIVLLDNMGPDQLRRAVELRNSVSPDTLLEASGGITLETVRAIAEAGVDRISIGGLTHSAPALDLGFDWPW
ncbi:MAG: carboxylating nicotinate-nucleotide diphosphorylase [Planctomycetaceae bacterium]|nr:carboxylating nicotinate-nucleotide diphosphorylase [Planctomycetaceae bacterium]